MEKNYLVEVKKDTELVKRIKGITYLYNKWRLGAATRKM